MQTIRTTSNSTMKRSYTYDDLISQLNSAITRVREFSSVPEDLLLLKPDATAWSADEIFRHIVRFNTLYTEQIDQIIGKNEFPTMKEESFRPGFISKLMISFMEPPYKLKIPTLAPMYPGTSEDSAPQRSIQNLCDTNEKLLEKLGLLQQERADLDRTRGNHPMLQWLPMSITELVLLLEAHQRRHFWQAEQTLYRLSGTRY